MRPCLIWELDARLGLCKRTLDYDDMREVVMIENYEKRSSHTKLVPNDQLFENIKFAFQGLTGFRALDQVFISDNSILEDHDGLQGDMSIYFAFSVRLLKRSVPSALPR